MVVSLLEHMLPQSADLPLRIIDHVGDGAEDHGGTPIQIVERPDWQAGDGRIAAADKRGPRGMHQVGQRLPAW